MPMTSSPDPHDDPAVTGVPPETPDAVRPSATGIVAGPLDEETDVAVADVHVAAANGADVEAETPAGASSNAGDDPGGDVDAARMDQLLEDAEGGVEASTLDAPDD